MTKNTTATEQASVREAVQMMENIEVYEQKNPRLTRPWIVAVVILTIAGILVAMNQVFFWNITGEGMLTSSYLNLLMACFLPIVLIVYPARKKTATAKMGVPWYDQALIIITILTCFFFASNAVAIAEKGWAFMAPTTATVMSYVLWLLILEILRRCAGPIVLVVAFMFSVYPLFAGSLPFSILRGIDYDLNTLAQVHAMGSESILGLPLQTAGTVLIGFLVFGIALQHTGGAGFFHTLSMAIFGRFRGGAAKVSVGSSAAMGMMSGSAVSNVLTTGPMTIPAMVRSGFSPKTAGAVEATASSGGSITPPVMGTAAFLMVSFVGVPYSTILIAATIPAFLYFLGIFLQIDGYSAIKGLKGAPKHLLPSARRALIDGWPYVLALVFLTVLLFTMSSEAQVPYYVVAMLIIVALSRKSVKFGPQQWLSMLEDIGATIGQIVGIIAGVGLILGGLSATGVALSLSRDLLALVDGNVYLILITGAFVSFVLGMGLTVSAAYVFLAIVMVPALAAFDIDPIATHLFVIYWATVSYITPPVGLAAFAAAGISKASPMGTSFESMRLGAVKYIVPFGFALNPALVAQDSVGRIVIALFLSIVAVWALAGSFGGYLTFIERRIPLWTRVLLGAAAFLLFLPNTTAVIVGLIATTGLVILTRIFGSKPLPVQVSNDDLRTATNPSATTATADY